MLILTRRVGEKIVIGDNLITVAVLSHGGGQVRLGVTAPPEMPVHREETAERIRDSHNNMRGNGAFYYGKASVSPLHIRTQAMADLMLGPSKGAAA